MRKSEKKSNQANEAISKFKLLSAYGGPGSIIHTEYGSIIISCIEEWGFIHELSELYKRGILLDEDADTIRKRAEFEEITISNDERLLQELRRRKGLPNLALLALIPSIELNEVFNTVKDNKTAFAINSEFMPKGFYDDGNRYKTYKEWYTLWSGSKQDFFPPKYTILSDKGNRVFDIELNQENIVLICKNGHISDFPWSKFLRWRLDNPHDINNVVDLFGFQTCCAKPDIQINETTANASGFDGKWLKCNNPGCTYKNGTSLKGLMSLKVVCPGHKPWESITGQNKSYNGAKEVRNSSPRAEACGRQDLKVALTTGNNIYFARSLTSIYMPPKLFLDTNTIKIKELEAKLEIAKDNGDWPLCMSIDEQIKAIASGMEGVAPLEQLTDREREIKFRFEEYTALVSKSIEEINIDRDNLTAYDVTENLDPRFACFFNRLLRIDRLKVTSAQLDFTRVEPYETGSSQVQNRNIFRSSPEQVLIYPVVENYGEGIFFSFNQEHPLCG